MRPLLTPLSLSLLFLTAPLCALATAPSTDLTVDEQRQQWEEECRASLAPYGQGDLEAALLAKLNTCINRKQNDQAIAQKLAKERERLSQRVQREAERRATIVIRSRKGTEMRIRSANARRIEQGTLFKRLRTPSRYQNIHRTLRGVEVPSATAD